MKLSILIPTYNRSTFLIKNLDLLSHYIRKGNFHKDIEIVISNNQSKDSTDVDIKYFQNNNIEINIQYFLQIENIGLEKNALFVLKEAKGNFVMYLGDDDYMDYQYLKETITTIEMEKLLTCIIPSNCPVNTQGHEQNYNKYKGRDLNLPNRMYKAGFYNCLSNSWRGHQLSGLVFKREGLIDEYHERNINNIYPFIFMVAYNSLRGKTLHLTQYPLKITVVDQHNKDWDYTADGLIVNIYDNYKKLKLNYIYRNILQLALLINQKWRYLKPIRLSTLIMFYKSMYIIVTSRSTLFGTKLFAALIMQFYLLNHLIPIVPKMKYQLKKIINIFN
ncbi:MAG: glycosyltransferase family 2 protein [Cytophagia bacterium]|jgi:abequosyltransferase|nr:glycosyltransferase family 2 protein [Cytophagia bacterium]